MVAKITPIIPVASSNNNYRSATDGNRKRLQNKASFKEVFAKEIANAAAKSKVLLK